MIDLRILTHPSCELHEMGAGHPEQPARVRSVAQAIMGSGIVHTLESAPQVSHAQLLRVHPQSYLDLIAQTSPSTGYAALDADTTMNPHSLKAAMHAAGAAVAAVAWVMAGDEAANPRRAFCNIRPPGHHALPAASMGFCIFANVAIAAKHALATCGADRVAIVDFDVHHGNGTEACVADDPRIRLYSTFQHPYYPHSGIPSSADNVVNVPLAWGSGGKDVRAAFVETILPDLNQFAPDLVIISAGFDAHRDDPLAGLNFVDEDYSWMTQQLVAIANTHARGRIVSCLEGGYHLTALASSVTAHLQALSTL